MQAVLFTPQAATETIQAVLLAPQAPTEAMQAALLTFVKKNDVLRSLH
ncbi:hypothetical protein [Flavobacterium sp. GCM10023249]